MQRVNLLCSITMATAAKHPATRAIAGKPPKTPQESSRPPVWKTCGKILDEMTVITIHYSWRRWVMEDGQPRANLECPLCAVGVAPAEYLQLAASSCSSSLRSHRSCSAQHVGAPCSRTIPPAWIFPQTLLSSTGQQVQTASKHLLTQRIPAAKQS